MISLCSLCPMWLTVFIHLKTGIGSDFDLENFGWEKDKLMC
jgi:hypothetical protein